MGLCYNQNRLKYFTILAFFLFVYKFYFYNFGAKVMKLRLIVETGTLAGKEMNLETGSLVLGRGLDCTLRFDATGDPGVSSHHALISLEQDGFYIVDQNSTNGTFINGSRVQRALLETDNIVQLGYQGPRIKIVIENPQLAPTLVRPAPENKPTLFWDESKKSSPLENQNTIGTPLLTPSTPINAVLPPTNQNFNPAINQQPNQLIGVSVANPNNLSAPPAWPSTGLSSNPSYNQSPNVATSTPSNEPNGTSILRQSFSNIGIYNPEKEKGGNKTIATLAVIGVGLIMTIIVALIMLSSVGLAGTVVGTILAFTPAPFYLLLFLWLDRYDPEPAWALGGAFAWGALFAVIVSFFVNTIFGSVAMTIAGGPVGNLLGSVISAPIIEEATKGLGVLLIAIFLRKEFDDIVDGIVYAGVIALGFATVENVLYYGSQFAESGIGPGLIFILFLRGVLSPFAHALFTSMTGIGCGIARETHNKALKITMPILGYVLAVFLHALWNGAAVFISAFAGGGAYFIFYFLVWVPLFLIMLGVMIYMVYREAKLIKQMLAIEVARGLISPEQLELIGSSFARVKWLSSSLLSGDIKKFSAQRKFLRAVTKLAFCYWHVARANEANSQTQSLPQIPRFQSEVVTLKSEI